MLVMRFLDSLPSLCMEIQIRLAQFSETQSGVCRILPWTQGGGMWRTDMEGGDGPLPLTSNYRPPGLGQGWEATGQLSVSHPVMGVIAIRNYSSP